MRKFRIIQISVYYNTNFYRCFMVVFLFPTTWLLYLLSAILGAGASITWTGQGNYLARCSDPQTISRNSGIFWALLQCSMFFGNIFVYFQFQDKTSIDSDTRRIVVAVLLGVAVLGIVFLCSLRPVSDNSSDADNELRESQTGWDSAVFALKEAGRLFVTKDMMLLSVTFLYTGLELSFFSGVYGSSIGFTSKISTTPKEIVGLAGICIGAGEVLAGGIFGVFGKQTTRNGRDPIVIAGYVLHVITFFLIFINLPNSSPAGNTSDVSYIDPRPWVALIAAFTLGFGDACFNTQIYSMLGGVFVKNSVGAFALFKFTQSVAAAISFFYSSHLGLHVQLAILLVFGTLGTVCFVVVEWSYKRRGGGGQIENHKE